MNRAVFLDTLYKLVTAGALVVLAYAEYRNLPPAPVPVPTPAPSPAPTPSPVPSVTPIARAAKAYRDGMAQEFKDASAAVKGGAIKGPPDLFVFLQTRAAPLQGGLKDVSASHATTDGKGWADANAMASELQAISDTLGAAK